MAVVTKYGKGVKDPNSTALPLAVHAEGRMRVITSGAIAVTNGDSIGSRHLLGKVPSSAVLLPQSTLYHGAATSVADYDIGIEKLDGTLVDIDVLADGLDISSAGTKGVLASVATGNIGKRLWELLGLSNDPGIEYYIVGNMKAAATATVNIEAAIFYVIK